MADLGDFGVTSTPVLRKGMSVDAEGAPDGYVGTELRSGDKCYIAPRNRSQQALRGEKPYYDVAFEGVAYGLPLDVYAKIDAHDISKVYVVVEDLGTVYQFTHQQFVDGDVIEDEGPKRQTQSYVPVEVAVDRWDDAHPGVYAAQPAFE